MNQSNNQSTINNRLRVIWRNPRIMQLKAKLAATLILVSLGLFNLNAQVVINEVFPNGSVELKNLGSSMVDVSGYFLCDFPAYQNVGNSNFSVGDAMLAPGEIAVIDNFNTISADDGEMGLYSSPSYGSSAAIVDYVEWGSSGHQRASVAIGAGIWSANSFVPAFGANESIAYSGSGDGVDSWTAGAPTLGAENGVSCDIVTNDITLENGETSAVICVDGNADPLTVVTNGGTDGTEAGWIITDASTNQILGLPAGGPFDLDGAGIGVCDIWYVRWEAGNFTGAVAGNNLSDLSGCFALSNPITVTRETPDGGMVALADGSTTYTGTAGDIVIDVMHMTTALNLSYWYIITDDNDNILAWANSANTSTLDLSGAPAGTCRVWGWSYRGLDDPIVGESISTLTDDDCEAISDNFITVIREANDCEIVTNDIALENGETTAVICVDGNADPLTVVTNGGTADAMTGWIITDANTNEILGLPAGGPFDLDGAGAGVCDIWYVRWEAGNFEGAVAGNNLSDLTGCFALSNPITVFREIPDGGMVALADGSTTYTGTAGDIVIDVMHMTTALNLSYWYIITDDNDNILAWANSADTNTLDLSGAPAGTCRVWGWSYRGLDDPIVGESISTLTDDDCEAISDNFITVIREANDCEIVTNDIALENGETTAVICVDGNADPLTVVTNGGTADAMTGWIITDANTGTILGLPAGGPFDLDGAGAGTCDIWYVRWEAGNFSGMMAGNNISDLEGCFALSNPITVFREIPDGGTVALATGGTFYTGMAGNINIAVTHTTTASNLSYWYIITDDNDNILAWANSANTNTLDLSGAPAGTCRVWGWSYRGLDDPIVGENISTLTDDDCEAISDNFITVVRQPADCEVVTNDIALENGETTAVICVDGNSDPLTVVTNGGSDGSVAGWIITDANTNEILGLPAGGPFDLDGAGAGVCEIWYIRWEAGNFGGMMAGNNLSDLTGCYDISNPITVIREIPDGGMVALADGSTTFTGTAGNIVVDVMHTTTAQNLSYWYIITDNNDNILDWANSANTNTLDLSGAPAGECHIWGWSYRGLDDPIVGENISTLTDDDCEAISDNFITVIREADCDIVTNDISLEDGSVTATICVDDMADPLTVITNGGTEGAVTGWIITDTNTGAILGLPESGPFDLNGAGAGVCDIWYVRWEAGNFGGAMVGNNLSDLTGCFDLSNPITVVRQAPEGGAITLEGGATETSICVDGTPDPLNVVFTEDPAGTNQGWVITDTENNILGLPASGPFDLDGAGGGTCLIWAISFEDDFMGAEVGANVSDLTGCFDLSNPITVVRQAPEGGAITLEGGETETSICVDGNPDPLTVVFTEDPAGTNQGWVITDTENNILGLPASGPFDLDGAGIGTCLIWAISFEDDFMGAEVGANVSDLTGCFDLSNPITVFRESPDGGTITTADGETEVTFLAGDVVFDVTHTTSAPNLSYWYIITSAEDVILGFQNPAVDGNTLDLSDAPAGTCRVWGWSYRGLDDPIVGENISTLTDDDCEAISEGFITVNRTTTATVNPFLDNNVIASPNPFSTEFTISFTADLGDAQVEVFDVSGKVVYFENREIRNGSSQTVNLANAASGIYFYTVSTAEGIANGKLLKK